METIQSVIAAIGDFLWGYILIFALIGCGVLFTVKMRFVQFTNLREMWRLLFNSRDSVAEVLNGAPNEDHQRKHISSFQAFVVALASRIGTGNLAGVATAISVGGPGAVFWMWLIALIGSATAFVESTLAQLYKRKSKDSYIGGPAYYMLYGLGKRWMGVLFAIIITATFGLANNSVQSNTICAAWQQAYGIDPVLLGGILTIVTIVIVFGGIQRVARFSEAVVPFMAIAYLGVALYVIITNITIFPQVMGLIISEAFNFDSAIGGGLGATVMQGVKRGLFSNEAGEGSAPNAAATASASHPVKQGMIQALGVFTDTLVVCSCTAFIILMGGVDIHASNGIQLTQNALTAQIGSIGNPLVAVAILLFAFSSVIGNYYYGEANIMFITRKKAPMFIYRLMSSGMVMLGAMMTLDMAWTMIDLMMALITICNLSAIVLLFGQVSRLLDDYLSQKRRGISEPVFHKSQMADIADKLDAWD